MTRGLVRKVKTSATVAYLSTVLYELGYIDTETLNDSLHELSRVKWLHGEILLSRGAITQAQLVEGLHEQTTRKLAYLFTLVADDRVSFDVDVDSARVLGRLGRPARPNPAIGVWRGVRDGLAQEDIDGAFANEAQTAFRLATVC